MGLTHELQTGDNWDEDAWDEDAWDEDAWDDLLSDLDEKKCIPFIGSGASDEWVHLDEIVKKWASEYHYPYPLGESSQLPRVCQYMWISKGEEAFPKKRLRSILKRIHEESLPNFTTPEYENNVYSVLADLNLPIYITTNYDHIMEKALTDKGKKPVSGYSIWKEPITKQFNDAQAKLGQNEFYDTSGGYPDIHNPNSGQSTSANPLVFHLLGDMDTPTYMVLSEKDYIDFAIYLSKMGDRSAFPHSIRQNLSSSTLLFVGYRLEDISFIIVFEGFIKLMSKLESKSVAVQVQMPSELGPTEKKSIRNYLKKLTESYLKIRIYWGDPDSFLRQLRNRRSKGRH